MTVSVIIMIISPTLIISSFNFIFKIIIGVNSKKFGIKVWVCIIISVIFIIITKAITTTIFMIVITTITLIIIIDNFLNITIMVKNLLNLKAVLMMDLKVKQVTTIIINLEFFIIELKAY